jgi:hypothetical protein
MTPTGEPSAATSSLHGNIRKPSEGRSTPIERSATPANKGDITSNNESNKTDADPEESNARTALATLRQIKPPRKRFLEVPSSADLTLGEVEDLLNEYRRLAKAIGEALASSS